MKNALYCLVFFLVPALSFSQESELGNWMILFGNKQLNEKYNWHHEVQYRNYDAAGDLEQLLLRTGIGMNINNQANLLLGYGFIRSENYINDTDKNVINENRIYQQFITRQKVKKLSIQHRYRFEQRFVNDDLRLRFRYFLQMAYPVWQNENRSVYLSVYDEIFLNTEGDPFDRNRLYGALGYKFNDKVKVEMGYMNQFLNGANRDQVNIVTFINW
ncbi:MAG: DUF2490 domain-containing protein [Bacteroidia bacterium]|nr:DUF2490 domain-containing protein [Bacteroidia bacterium]